jgi:hypothetical protein
MGWSAWALLAAAGLASVGLLVRWGARRWDASVRGDFVEYLRANAPDVEVLEVREREISVRTKDGSDGVIFLPNLFAAVANIDARDRAGREAIFSRFVGMAHQWGSATNLTERDRDRVRPRLVNEAFLARLRGEVKDVTIPAAPSGVAGLFVVFVLDSPESVAYVNDRHLEDLKLSEADALALAKANLSRAFNRETVRRVLSDRSISVVKTGDTFDAARLLLVPDALEPGESVAALIPDRDTLALTVVPGDGDWAHLRKLARAAEGDPLWTEPLIVTSEGIGSLITDH